MASILQVSSFYNKFKGRGGVELVVGTLSESLARHHDVRVLCTQDGSATETYIDRGVSVTAIGSKLLLSGRPLTFGALQEVNQDEGKKE